MQRYHWFSLIIGLRYAIGDDPTCWIAYATWDHCCHPNHGLFGNKDCWDTTFSYRRCCATDCLLHPEACKKLDADDAQSLKWTAYALRSASLDLTIHADDLEVIRGKIFASSIYEHANPMTSFLAHYEKKLAGLPGYGEAGVFFEAYSWILCRIGVEVSSYSQRQCGENDVNPLLDRYAPAALFRMHEFHELFYLRAYLFFQVALQFVQDCILDPAVSLERCRPVTTSVVKLLTAELAAHQIEIGRIIQSANGSEQDFVLRLGTFSDIVFERAAGNELMEKWRRTIELWTIAPDPIDAGYLLTILLQLSNSIAEAAVLFMMQAFARFYVSTLRALLKPLAESCSSSALQSSSSSRDSCELIQGTAFGHYRLVFHPICCYRYHVLLQLLQQLKQQERSELRMLEIGVHQGANAEYLLSRLPSLTYIGVDPFVPEGGFGSGNEMFTVAHLRLLKRFGPRRVRLLRTCSSVAWKDPPNISGIQPGSLDLLFVDGDHSITSAASDLRAWSKFVRPGGIVAGHDLFNPANDGVAQAVLGIRGGREDGIGHEVNIATEYTFWWNQP